jgi:uncharacterized protein (TIGR00730 family)
MKRLCVFCGSSVGSDPAYADAARALGERLARRSIRLVYGAGNVGLMGVLADAALAAGGEVMGVIPAALVAREVAHAGLTDLRVVHSMHERKAIMADLSDGFLALPGGFGTLEEFCEVLTWGQLGLHAKPCGLLNVGGYYDHFLRHLDQGVTQQLLRAEHRALVLEDSDPDRLLDRMVAYEAPFVSRWIDRTET